MPKISQGASAARKTALAAQAAAIAAARSRLGFTQSQAAATLNVSLERYRSWEYGTRQPPPEIRRTLVEAWACDPVALAWQASACPCCGRHF